MSSRAHYGVLDGWRGVSIALVLAAHLVPLSPKPWQFNHASGVLGMVLFFVLSGFLITTLLLKGAALPEFLVRRAFRILPLAWAYLALALITAGASWNAWLAHFLFYANLPPKQLIFLTEHLWSVCVEVQFYAGVAILVAALGVRGLVLLPVLCLGITLLRMLNGIHYSSITYYRFDEILAGCTLAIVYHCRHGAVIRQVLAASPQWPLLLLLAVSSLSQSGWLNYLRPYLGAAVIGATLLNPRTSLVTLLSNRILAYLAAISYALYVIHPMLAASWLGSGEIFEKYSKRPLLFIVLFSLAHLSTYCFERRLIAVGKDLSTRRDPLPGQHPHA